MKIVITPEKGDRFFEVTYEHVFQFSLSGTRAEDNASRVSFRRNVVGDSNELIGMLHAAIEDIRDYKVVAQRLAQKSSPPEGGPTYDLEAVPDKVKKATMDSRCVNCAACCMDMNLLPLEQGEAMPAAYKRQFEAIANSPRRGNEGMPCLWLNRETGECLHYDHRPQTCRDLDIGGVWCKVRREACGLVGAV